MFNSFLGAQNVGETLSLLFNAGTSRLVIVTIGLDNGTVLTLTTPVRE